jgi:phytoene dehydrogenase-like protein
LTARRAVIAACPPQAVPGLVGDAFDPRLASRLASAPDDAWGIGQLTVTLALSDQVELPLHRPRRKDVDLRKPTLMTGTLDSIVRAAQQSMQGLVPDELPWWATIFNAIDPSQAPEGQDVIDLYSPMVPGRPHGGWEQHRQAAADRLVDAASSVLSPRIREIELGRFIETPADRAERVGTRNGCIYHIDFLPTRVGPLRPALGLGTYRTPIKSLYLSGVGTHPPAGVSGLNGTRTAETVLRDIGVGKKRGRSGPRARRIGDAAAARAAALRL